MEEKKALTDEELMAQFADIPAQDIDAQGTKPTNTAASGAGQAPVDADDVLAELQNLAAARPASRPETPKLSSTTSTNRNRSPKRTDPTAAHSSARVGDDKGQDLSSLRKPVEGSGTLSQRLAAPEESAPASEPEKIMQAPPAPEPKKERTAGSWWGGMLATATAAVKQAESAVKEIQKNEEAQRWAEQVKGNVGALRGLGGELRSRALPTFTNLIHTLAPPISQHERLQIHITHDLIGYPSLDPTIYQTFSRVMAQVEGGDLMVIQRGSESSHRRSSDAGFTGSGTAGWNDGPWWRQNDIKRDMGPVKGLVEGTKLARASAEAYANEYFASRGGVEEAAKNATQILSDANPVRSSDIFLAIQAISHTSSDGLFAGPAEESKSGGMDDPKELDELVSFAIILHDPIHGLSFHTVTQSIPQKWADWLDASPSSTDPEVRLPDEILEIIRTGGVDPREWVSEWVEEVLTLGVGVVAQRYVARRMGVGEGGIGRGKAREQALESGAGEAARAL